MSKEISNITRRSCLSLLLVLAASQAMSAQQSAPAGATTPAAAAGPSVGAASDGARASQPASQYRIGPRDVLAIRVTAPDIVAQFSSDAMEVDECGMIPLLSVQNEEQAQVRAAGLTTGELREQLRKFYTKY